MIRHYASNGKVKSIAFYIPKFDRFGDRMEFGGNILNIVCNNYDNDLYTVTVTKSFDDDTVLDAMDGKLYGLSIMYDFDMDACRDLFYDCEEDCETYDGDDCRND